MDTQRKKKNGEKRRERSHRLVFFRTQKVRKPILETTSSVLLRLHVVEVWLIRFIFFAFVCSQKKKKKKKIKKNENTALDSAEWHYFFPSYLPNVVRFIKPQMREMTKRQQLDALKRPTYTRDDTGSFAFARGACILYSMGIWWRIWTRNLVRCSSILIYVGCNNKNN